MSSINVPRVILGGLAAGVVVAVSEGLVNGWLLQWEWAEAMKALNRPEVSTSAIIGFNIWSLLIGLTAVWLYAALRPRFGQGPGTAIKAALVVWLLGYVLANAAPFLTDLFPAKLLAIGIAIGLVEVIVGTLLGAKIYTETPEPAERTATARAR